RKRDRDPAPQANAAGPSVDPSRQAHPPILTEVAAERCSDELTPTAPTAKPAPPGGGTWTAAAGAAPAYFRPRTTGMSNSRIFLRSALRLRPKRWAALIWLPRVAPRVATISGRSIS